VAAVSASCSGDKSDKEESAGGFRYYGDCALWLQRLMRRASGILTTGGVCRFIYPAWLCHLVSYDAAAGV